MKSQVLSFKTVSLLVTFLAPIYLFGLNYTISFTGSGASTTVESVIVQNLTKGTTITVPAGNVLNLTDIATSTENTSSQIEGICVFPNPISNTATVSFYAKQSGEAQITVFDLEGRKIVGQNEDLLQGNISFKLSLPKGNYLIKVQGNGYSYYTKAICQSASTSKPKISISLKEQVSFYKPQKSKSAITTMLYTTGDQLLYKGISGNFSTIVTDKPESSKTTNFDFIECKDADSNYYTIVKIGSQVWMAENLKTTKYIGGEAIINVIDNNVWNNFTIGAWCNYNNDVANGIKYGHLYNWYAASDSRNIAPIGWHVPTNDEWTMLTIYLGGGFDVVDRGKLKEVGLLNWASPNISATNSTGFSALPGGLRESFGMFNNISYFGYWWTASEYDATNGWDRSLSSTLSQGSDANNKQIGFSVRCLRNNLPTLSTTIASALSITSAISGGNITDNAGLVVTARGVCWSTNHNPTITDNKSIDGSGIGTFSSSISSLLPNTTYYLRAYATNNNGTGYGSEVSFTTNMLAIGDSYLGGKVAYIDDSGIHGFVCSPTDIDVKMTWYNGSYLLVSGARNYNLETNGVYGISKSGGRKNTDEIVQVQGAGSYAAYACATLTLGNATLGDWYLPSKGELQQMYNNKTILGNFIDSDYWSSSEGTSSEAWIEYFKNGQQYKNYKSSVLNVRAIRAF